MPTHTAGYQDNNGFQFQCLLIPLLYLLILAYLSQYHESFEEYDGVMQYFSSLELVSSGSYIGWASHFWPPLYSVILALAAPLGGGHNAAIFISISSALCVLVTAFYLALKLFGNKRAAYCSQLVVAINPLFLVLSIQAENHMLDTCFFIFSIYVAIQAFEKLGIRAFVFLGVCCASAGLSRYTSYILVPSVLLCLFLVVNDFKRFSLLAVAYTLSFISVSSLWWVPNAFENGSPLHTWQYLNIGSSLAVNKTQWWWSLQENYNGLVEVMQSFPLAYAMNLLGNLAKSFEYVSVMTAGSLFVLPFAIRFMWRQVSPRFTAGVLATFLLYVLLVSQAFVFKAVFLSWIVIFSVWSVGFLIDLCRRNEKWSIPLLNSTRRAAYFALGLIVLISLLSSGEKMAEYLENDHIGGGQLIHKEAITRILQKEGGISGKYIMSIHPARAYYVGSNWISAPLYYAGSLSGLVSYENIGKKVRSYAPKYPSSELADDFKADYLIYDQGLAKHLPQFKFLLDEKGGYSLPLGFEVLFQSKEAIVIKINKTDN